MYVLHAGESVSWRVTWLVRSEAGVYNPKVFKVLYLLEQHVHGKRSLCLQCEPRSNHLSFHEYGQHGRYSGDEEMSFEFQGATSFPDMHVSRRCTLHQCSDNRFSTIFRRVTCLTQDELANSRAGQSSRAPCVGYWTPAVLSSPMSSCWVPAQCFTLMP